VVTAGCEAWACCLSCPDLLGRFPRGLPNYIRNPNLPGSCGRTLTPTTRGFTSSSPPISSSSRSGSSSYRNRQRYFQTRAIVLYCRKPQIKENIIYNHDKRCILRLYYHLYVLPQIYKSIRKNISNIFHLDKTLLNLPGFIYHKTNHSLLISM
jgi:hypothetical protein